MKHLRGFTIIEISVVIVVIGILATLLIVTYNAIQMQARDSKRVADVRIMASRMQKYFEQNGEFPPVSDAYIASISASGINDPTDIAGWNYSRNMTTSYCGMIPRWGGGDGSLGPSCRNYGYLSGSNATSVSDDGTHGPGCTISGNINNKPYYAIAWYDESSGTIQYAGSNIVVTKNATSVAFPREICQQTDL